MFLPFVLHFIFIFILKFLFVSVLLSCLPDWPRKLLLVQEDTLELLTDPPAF